MTELEKIKAEIERRMKINQWDDSEGSDVAFSEDKRLLSFIESLEQESKDKTNRLFEECLAEVDPNVREEVQNNIDKILQEPKIKGWVARESDGYIYMFAEKPKRNQKTGGWSGKTLLEFPKDTLPEILWSSEPIEVELTINKIL